MHRMSPCMPVRQLKRKVFLFVYLSNLKSLTMIEGRRGEEARLMVRLQCTRCRPHGRPHDTTKRHRTDTQRGRLSGRPHATTGVFQFSKAACRIAESPIYICGGVSCQCFRPSIASHCHYLPLSTDLGKNLNLELSTKHQVSSFFIFTCRLSRARRALFCPCSVFPFVRLCESRVRPASPVTVVAVSAGYV